ncbi:MAG: hypothetical protein AB1486_19985 [Planctomycetota bacterium]
MAGARAPLNLMLGAALLLTACFSTEKKQVGSPFLTTHSQLIHIGQAKTEVLSKLGAPWSINPAGPQKELYIWKSQQQERHTIFFPPVLVVFKKSWSVKDDERRLTLAFENNRVVDMKYEVRGDDTNKNADGVGEGPEGKIPGLPRP